MKVLDVPRCNAVKICFDSRYVCEHTRKKSQKRGETNILLSFLVVILGFSAVLANGTERQSQVHSNARRASSWIPEYGSAWIQMEHKGGKKGGKKGGSGKTGKKSGKKEDKRSKRGGYEKGEGLEWGTSSSEGLKSWSVKSGSSPPKKVSKGEDKETVDDTVDKVVDEIGDPVDPVVTTREEPEGVSDAPVSAPTSTAEESLQRSFVSGAAVAPVISPTAAAPASTRWEGYDWGPAASPTWVYSGLSSPAASPVLSHAASPNFSPSVASPVSSFGWGNSATFRSSFTESNPKAPTPPSFTKVGQPDDYHETVKSNPLLIEFHGEFDMASDETAIISTIQVTLFPLLVDSVGSLLVDYEITFLGEETEDATDGARQRRLDSSSETVVIARVGVTLALEGGYDAVSAIDRDTATGYMTSFFKGDSLERLKDALSSAGITMSSIKIIGEEEVISAAQGHPGPRDEGTTNSTVHGTTNVSSSKTSVIVAAVVSGSCVLALLMAALVRNGKLHKHNLMIPTEFSREILGIQYPDAGTGPDDKGTQEQNRVSLNSVLEKISSALPETPLQKNHKSLDDVYDWSVSSMSEESDDQKPDSFQELHGDWLHDIDLNSGHFDFPNLDDLIQKESNSKHKPIVQQPSKPRGPQPKQQKPPRSPSREMRMEYGPDLIAVAKMVGLPFLSPGKTRGKKLLRDEEAETIVFEGLDNDETLITPIEHDDMGPYTTTARRSRSTTIPLWDDELSETSDNELIMSASLVPNGYKERYQQGM